MTVRRLKSYTGQTGYVYQYYFVGKRPAMGEHAPGTEYVFDVSSDRHSYFAVSIFVQESALQAWAASHGRELSEPEQYATAKFSLFQAFDDISDLARSERRFAVTPETVENLVEALNL